MFCIAPLWTLALGLPFLNESLTKQLRFPHAPALTHTYLYTHVPAPSWTQPARCSGICLGTAAPPWEALHVRGLYTCPERWTRPHTSRPVNWKGCNLFTTLSFLEVCLQERGFLWAALPAARTRASAEPSAQCWIAVWNATGCQILDSLFLMKIPPVIPRISCSAKKKKNERCVYFAVGWIFSCSSQFPLWTERRRRRGKQLTA